MHGERLAEDAGTEAVTDAHERPARGIRFFSSASDAPRVRRPTDAILFVLALLSVALLSIPAPGPTAIDTAVTNLLTTLPGLFGWFWEISYDLLIGWALVLLVAPLIARGRLRLFVDEVLAGSVALGSALLAGWISGTDWSDSLGQVTASGKPAVYLAVRLAIATAVVVTASPHLVRPFKHVGRWVIAIGALAGITLGTTLPIGMIAGLLIGIGSAALVHLFVGSPGGRLTLDQISDALQELGVEAFDLENAPLEPRGVALALGRSREGASLLVKVFGRDAWDGQLLASTWSSLWNRGTTPSLGSSRAQQVEHEAFVTLFAERGGAPVLPVVAAGTAAQGDALLVLETTGRPLGTLAPEEIDDAMLRACWAALADLHVTGIAHGRIDDYRIVIRPDGSPAFGDFGDATYAATDGALHADEAQLLVTTALAIGQERAVGAAADALGAEGLMNVLPYLQPAVLDLATRRAIRERDWKLKDLRTLAAERTGAEPPALEQLRRVSLRSIVKLAVIGLLVYGIFSAFTNIGIQTLVDEFKGAGWGWLAAALIMSPISQVPQAFSTLGATMQPIRFGPVLMLQYGVQFIQLAVPSSAARIALEIRFFQRAGVPGAGAMAIGMIDSFSTFLLQMLLILIITLSGLASLELSAINSDSSSTSTSSSGSSSPGPDWIVILGLLLIVAVIVVLAVPRFRVMLTRFRAALREKAADGREALRVLRYPSKWLYLFGGNLVAQVLLAIILGLCLRAFGHSASLASLILVNTCVSLFAGFMPVPGGVGVAEAGYTAGLMAIGIPSSAAASTAIAFRLVTFYIPPLWGVFATRWMKDHSYL